MNQIPQFKPETKAKILLRCAIFWLLLLAMLLLTGPITPMFPQQAQRFSFGVLGTVAALLLTWLFLKHEGCTLKDIGLVWQSGTLGRFLIGLVIGSALFGLILLTLLLFTPLQIKLNAQHFNNASLSGYLAFIPLSLMEEIGFRAYPLQKLHSRFGLRGTQVVIAIVFALYHVAGGQSIVSSFLGPGVYAFVFGLAAVWSGGIAMPFGIHLALNLWQPLAGMREGMASIWTLRKKADTVSSSMPSPDTVGIIMQLVVLAVALLLTEYFIAKKERAAAT